MRYALTNLFAAISNYRLWFILLPLTSSIFALWIRTSLWTSTIIMNFLFFLSFLLSVIFHFICMPLCSNSLHYYARLLNCMQLKCDGLDIIMKWLHRMEWQARPANLLNNCMTTKTKRNNNTTTKNHMLQCRAYSNCTTIRHNLVKYSIESRNSVRYFGCPTCDFLSLWYILCMRWICKCCWFVFLSFCSWFLNKIGMLLNRITEAHQVQTKCMQISSHFDIDEVTVQKRQNGMEWVEQTADKDNNRVGEKKIEKYRKVDNNQICTFRRHK